MFWKRKTHTIPTKKTIPFNELKLDSVITERLDYTIYTQDEIDKIKSAAYRRNNKNGKYIIRRNGFGPYHPAVVGMPDCSNSLVYDRANDRWLLTDGLGNGWIR